MKVYLHLAEGFEEIEALTVVDVLRRASINVETVSISQSKEVNGAHNIKVFADLLFEEANYNQCDMIVLPGGMPGTVHLEGHQGLIENIKQFYNQGKWIAAICAAPKILGNLGILSEKTATCYPGFEKELKGAIMTDESVVQAGKIITSKGPGTAILFSLKIVDLLRGKEIAEEVKKNMMVG